MVHSATLVQSQQHGLTRHCNKQTNCASFVQAKEFQSSIRSFSKSVVVQNTDLTHSSEQGLLLAHQRGWLSLSLAVTVYFGIISLHHAFSHDYLVQDDVRLHTVWLQQYIDPQLFPDDLIAKYYRTIAPVGFKSVYWVAAQLGIEPLVLAKILPIILAAIATVYLFQVSLLLLPVPAAAFLTTLLQNQNFWTEDDLISAVPRAFIYPIFAAFLYYLLRRAELPRKNLIPCLFTLALQGLFYPQMLLVSVTVLTIRLFRWRGRSPRLAPNADFRLWLGALGVVLIVIFPYSWHVAQEFGPLVTRAQMQAMPEFSAQGRSAYFSSPLSLFRGTSGILAPLYPPIIWVSVSLPWLNRFSLAKLITPKVTILWHIVLAAFGLFFLSHLVYLKLYLPSRYTYYSLRFVMAIASGLALFVLLEAGGRWLRQKTSFSRQEKLLTILTSAFLTVAFIFPAIPVVFLSWQNWIGGEAPAVYQFLAAQPQDTLIASIAKEADNLPAFSQRSVLFSQEFSLAFHLAYYNQIRQRASALILAQYSAEPSELQRIIRHYHIDFWLIDRTAFDPNYLQAQPWLFYSSFNAEIQEAITLLERGETSALAELVPQCSVVSTEKLILLDAVCLSDVP